MDSDENAYYPVICSLDSLESKAFLVQDPVAGLEILKKTELQSVITGGVVTECAILPLKSVNAFAGY